LMKEAANSNEFVFKRLRTKKTAATKMAT
jgi:hypothetical protein